MEWCGRTAGRAYMVHECQDFGSTCLVNKNAPATELEAAPSPLMRPPEQRDTSFQLQDDCAASGARDHTMAQAVYLFKNDCDTVADTITGRAMGEGGWADPHNGGHYTLLSAQSDMLKLKRVTGNQRYTDVITFAMSPHKDGCNVNACSVSQGNSNNDAGTNMCNMRDLICADDGCSATGKDKLDYNIATEWCGRTAGRAYLVHECQDFATTCLVNKNGAAKLAAPPLMR